MKSLVLPIYTLLITIPKLFLTVLGLTISRILKPKEYDDERGRRIAAAGEVKHPHVAGVTHETVQAAGLSIHVARAGIDSTKKLILLLHGFPEFWYSWRAQIEGLQGEFEIAAMDLPGYNASDKPIATEAYMTRNVATVVAAALGSLGRSTCVLVGHDWGGVIAYQVAASFPDKVSRLAVLTVPPGPLFKRNMDLKQLGMSHYMNLFSLPLFGEAALRRGDYAFTSVFTDPSKGGCVSTSMSRAEEELYKDALAVPGALRSGLLYYRALTVNDMMLQRNKEAHKDWKGGLKMPVLQLAGDRDLALSLNLFTNFGDVCPNGDVRVVPNCSHWMQQDAPETVNRLLREWALQE